VLEGFLFGAPVSCQLVVVVATGLVGEHRVGMVDLAENLLSVNSVTGVSLGIPLCSQILIGLIDLVVRGISADTKDLI
jgi:hypothetical protein